MKTLAWFCCTAGLLIACDGGGGGAGGVPLDATGDAQRPNDSAHDAWPFCEPGESWDCECSNLGCPGIQTCQEGSSMGPCICLCDAYGEEISDVIGDTPPVPDTIPEPDTLPGQDTLPVMDTAPGTDTVIPMAACPVNEFVPGAGMSPGILSYGDPGEFWIKGDTRVLGGYPYGDRIYVVDEDCQDYGDSGDEVADRMHVIETSQSFRMEFVWSGWDEPPNGSASWDTCTSEDCSPSMVLYPGLELGGAYYCGLTTDALGRVMLNGAVGCDYSDDDLSQDLAMDLGCHAAGAYYLVVDGEETASGEGYYNIKLTLSDPGCAP